MLLIIPSSQFTSCAFYTVDWKFGKKGSEIHRSKLKNYQALQSFEKKNQMFVKHLKILLLCSSPKLVLGNYILKIQFKYKSKILSFWNCIVKPSTVSSKENIRNRNRKEKLNLAEMESMKRSPDLRVLVGGFDSVNPPLKKIESS